MDKPRDVRRGASRFSTAKRRIKKQSGGHKLLGGFKAIGGDIQFSEKSKKEKVRSLSAVGRALSSYQHCEMGCHVSEKPDALPAQSSSSAAIIATKAKRFKIPRKFLNDCNGVDHASVPRKIRSAMKKRSRESIFPDSEKLNHKINGIESPENDGIKKFKVSIKQGSPERSPRQAVSGPITKDEEEVAETLYALAGMFPDNGSNGRSELDGDSLPENSVLQDLEGSVNAAFEASGTAEDAGPCPERSPRGAAKISSLNEIIDQEQPDFPESAKFLVASHSSVPKINLQTKPMMVGCENGYKIGLHDSELCLAMGLNMPRQSQTSHGGRKPVGEFETAGGIDWKQQQHMINDQKENGPALWPGLSPRASGGNGIDASYLRSSAARAPDWLDAAICASKQDLMESCSSGRGKISEVVNHKKSWQRCAGHVHISHLIQSLEVPKRQVTKEPELHEYHQMRAHEGSKCGVFMEVHNMSGMRNGISSAPGTSHSATVRNFHETKNGVLQQQCHYHDTSQASPTPGLYGSQKQGFNFLSLSAGGIELKVNNSFNKVGSSLEPFPKFRVPYFQSQQQQHGPIPVPSPQSQYPSTSHLDQLPVAGPQGRLRQPEYYGSPLCGTHYCSTVSNKQQHQSFWAVQLAAHGRSAVDGNIVRAQNPNWQSGRHDSSLVGPCAQAILPNSPPSLVLGSKITSISEQQQQLIALASSLPPSSTNGLDFHLNSVCEECKGRFRCSGTPSLQLLCDERI